MTFISGSALRNLGQKGRAKGGLKNTPFAQRFARGKISGKAGQSPKTLCPQRELANDYNGLEKRQLCPGFARNPISSRRGKHTVSLDTVCLARLDGRGVFDASRRLVGGGRP